MSFVSVKQASEKWNITERVVRQYCADGRVPGAFISGKTWYIPDTAEKPKRKAKQLPVTEQIVARLLLEKENGLPGGIYHRVQIDFTYNSNHIEGSRLSEEQTRYIFETNTIDVGEGSVNVDDIIETANHFRCIDLIIDQVKRPVTEAMIKQLHFLLKNGTSDSRKNWFAVGQYKRMENDAGGKGTTDPNDVPEAMKKLLSSYRKKKNIILEDLLEFHYKFESIHPFQDGNGRVGRLILFKECLRNGIVPFIIEDDLKLFYYRGLREWNNEKGYLLDTCLTAQDRFKTHLDIFGIRY